MTLKEQLQDIEFAIIDVETTGLSPQGGDRVVEIAALKVKNLEAVKHFEALINPQREMTFGAYLVNGISDAMLKDQPKAEEVLPDFREFIGQAYLVGHNIKFDLGFINNELEMAGMGKLEDYVAIDTVRMSRGLLPELGKYSLSHLAQKLEVEQDQKHRALADVEMTWGVFSKLLDIAEQKGFQELQTLIELFGVHKHKRVRQYKEVKIQMINEAIADQVHLNVLYFGANSGATTRKVTPREIQGRGREATLIGYCHLRREDRNFIIDRIVNLEKLISS